MQNKSKTRNSSKMNENELIMKIDLLNKNCVMLNKKNKQNYKKLEILKNNNLIKKEEIEARIEIQNERKSNIQDYPQNIKNTIRNRYKYANNDLNNTKNENERTKQSINDVYQQLSKLSVPISTYSDVDFEIDSAAVSSLEQSNKKRRIYLFHMEELNSFINMKMQSFNETEKEQNQILQKLQEKSEMNTLKKSKSVEITSKTFPSNIENEIIVDELEKEINKITEQIKNLEIEMGKSDAIETKELAYISNLEDENKSKRELLNHRAELLEEEKRNYVAPVFNVNEFELSPRKVREQKDENEKEEVGAIIDQINNHLNEMQETCQEEENTINKLQCEYLEKRKEIEKDFFQKAQKIRELRSKLAKIDKLEYDSDHMETSIEESKDLLADVKNYKKRMIRIKKIKEEEKSGEQSRVQLTLYQKKKLEMSKKMPPIESLSPRRTTQERHIAQKSRQIEANERSINLIKENIETLKQEIKEREENINEIEEQQIY